MTQNMWNVFILLGGILLFVTVIGVLDLVARRRQRRDVHRT
jgi:nitrate reductase gamma subunit